MPEGNKLNNLNNFNASGFCYLTFVIDKFKDAFRLVLVAASSTYS